jgi:hypothetical protein
MELRQWVCSVYPFTNLPFDKLAFACENSTLLYEQLETFFWGDGGFQQHKPWSKLVINISIAQTLIINILT